MPNSNTATAAFNPVQTIIDAANQYGVDPNFALKIANQESRINPNTPDSKTGAIGTMQLEPGTAADLGVDPRDPVQNIQGGVRYLRQMLDQFGGNQGLAAGAYNAGPGRMRAYLAGQGTLPLETQNYITAVGNSPITAQALGYTAAAPRAPSVAQFVANPTGAQPAPVAPGGADDWAPVPMQPAEGDDWQPISNAAAQPTAAPPAGDGDWMPVETPAPATNTPTPALSQQPSSAMDVLRSIGAGLRNAAESTAGLPGDLEGGVNWVGNKLLPLPPGAPQPGSAGGIPAPPTSSTIDKAVSAVAGPAYQPKTTAGEYAQSIAEFAPAAIGGEGGVIRRAAQAAVPAVASQGAGDAAAALGASPGVQDAIKIATAIGAGVPLSAPGAGPVNQALAAADRLNVPIPKYMATDGSVLPRLAQGAKAVPFGGAPVVKSAGAVSKGLQDAVDTIAPNTPADVAGNAAKSALVQNIKVDAPADVSAKYDAAESLMTNPDATVPMTNTVAKMQDLMAARANARLPEWSPAMNALANAVTDPAGMNFAGIKMLRSVIGERTPQQLIAEGLDPKEVRQLYGPLTQDLQSAVGAAGGQPALNAWQEADTLAATNAAGRKQLYNIIGAKADAPPEAVFGKLVQLAGTKSRADISLLQQAKQAMGPQAWQQVGNAIISRLGRDPQGNFSADRFIGPNGYAGLSPAAKSVLFTPQQRAQLDDLNSVSNQVNEKISKFTNSSKTADVSKAAELLGGLWIHPTGTIATIAGTRGAAYLLSRPAVAQAAVRLGRAQLAGSISRTTLAHNALVSAIRAQPPTAGQQ
jgi:Transglycosylase SLT domain